MKTVLIILFFLYNTLGAQNLIEYSIEKIDWKKWDVLHNDNQGKMDYFASHHIEKRPTDGSGYTLAPSDAKMLDIDGDGTNDMLYQEKGIFWIYLNKKDSLHIIATISEQISEISRSWPDAPLNFTTVDLNCCEKDEWGLVYYHFFTADNTFSYKPYRKEIISNGTMDLFRNMPPTKVKVAASQADLVLGPGSTNIIKSYETGRSGYAVASIKDESGTLWWKVFMKESDYMLRTGWIAKNKLVPVYSR